MIEVLQERKLSTEKLIIWEFFRKFQLFLESWITKKTFLAKTSANIALLKSFLAQGNFFVNVYGHFRQVFPYFGGTKVSSCWLR